MFKSKSLKLFFLAAVVTLITVFSSLSSGVSAASLTNDFNQLNQSQIVSEMGAGWNLGNQLEANIDGMPWGDAWGNPKITQALITKIKSLGFKTIRIPISY